MKFIPALLSARSTRRSVLRWSGAGVVAAAAASLGWRRGQKLGNLGAAGVPGGTPRGTRPHPPTTSAKKPAAPVKPMSRESFVPHLASAFHLSSESYPTTVCTLLEISPASEVRGRTTTFTSFALLFDVPHDFPAESKIYTLTHDQLGAMKVFLSPVGKPGRRGRLEAVFSQAA